MTARCLDCPISADFFSADDSHGIASMDNFFDGSERQPSRFPGQAVRIIIAAWAYIENAMSWMRFHCVLPIQDSSIITEFREL